MKVLMSLMFLVLTACASNSDSNQSTAGDPGLPANLPPTCKTLYNVWTADTDQTRFDFSGLGNGMTINEYEFKANDGSTCGYVSNPNHNLSAVLQVGGPSFSYDYLLKMHYSLAPGGQCSIYENTPGSKDQTAVIRMPVCGEIQICLATGAGTCKTFH